MKALKILGMAGLIGLFLTACEKDDFTLKPDVPPSGVEDQVFLGDGFSNAIQPADVVHLSSKFTATIVRNDVHLMADGTADFPPDMYSKLQTAANDEVLGYTLSGNGDFFNEVFGWAMIAVDLESNEHSGELTGLITMQSMEERATCVTFRAFGYSNIQQVGNSSGVSFRLEVLQGTGSFSAIDRFANAVLTGYVDDLYRYEDKSMAVLQVNVTYRPVITY